MNVFQAIGKVIKAANTSYLESVEEKKNFSMRQEAIIQEKNHKALLREQLEQLLTVANEMGYKALQIEIVPECDIYVSEVIEGLECELVSLGEGQYLLKPEEVILDE